MNAEQESGAMSPCYFPASLIGNNQFHRMTVTRIGVDRALLTGEAPMVAGARTLLEMNRPTDGESIRVPIRIVRIRDEGRQFGWKPAFHVEFIEPLSNLPSLRQSDEVVLDATDSGPFSLPSVDLSLTQESVEPSVQDSSEEVLLLSSPEPPVHHSISMDDLAASASVAPAGSPADDGPPSADLEVPSAETLGSPDLTALPRRESAWTPWSGAPVQKVAPVDREDRVLSQVPVTYFGAGGEHSGMAQDFSRQGMFLAVLPDEPLPRLGEVVRVQFPVPEGEDVAVVGLHGEVRWTHGADRGAARGKGIGLQIVRFDDEAGEQAYLRWVAFLLTAD